MSKLLILLFLVGNLLYAETPPSPFTTIKGGTDGTKIGNVGDALKVNVTSGGGGGTVNQGTGGISPWLTSRNWTLTFAGDKVDATGSVISAAQSGSWTTGRTWNLLNTTDSVNVGNFPASQTVNGTVTANAGTGTFTVGQSSGANLHVDVDNFPGTQPISGTVTSNQGTPNTIGNAWPAKITDGTNTASVTASSALKVDGSAVTQPVSGTVTANAGTGTFTVGQSSGANLHVNVDSAPTTTVTGTVTANQGTTPWVDNVSQFGGNNVVTGTGTSGVGIPRVTVSSDSSLTNISGTISLPTGASTSANQTNGSQKSQIVDGSGNVISSTSNALNVNTTQGTSPWVVSGTVTATQTALVTGSISNASVTGTASTITAPANAIGFILEAESGNTANIRWAVGSTATASVGMLAEPGRDSGYIPLAANISVISLSGTQTVDVQWVVR